jgi:hypothetical protein
VYEAATSIRPKGALINLVTRDKAPKFHTMLVPYPTAAEKEMIRGLLAQSETTLAWPNPTACLDFAKVCEHFTEGRCSRG